MNKTYAGLTREDIEHVVGKDGDKAPLCPLFVSLSTLAFLIDTDKKTAGKQIDTLRQAGYEVKAILCGDRKKKYNLLQFLRAKEQYTAVIEAARSI